MEDTLSTWLAASRDRHFDLIIATKTFGGRHGEAMLTPVACQVVGPILVIRFKGSERLTVSDSSGATLGPEGELLIEDGTEARFTWYYYGRPQLPENLCEDVFVKTGKTISFTRIGPLLPTSTSFPHPGDAFVKLV